jgi:hypothetical protein
MHPHIPAELLDEVFSYLSSKNEFRNLALVSKHCYQSAVPHLYRTLDLRTFWDGPSELNAKPHPLKHLATLFLARPDLALYVKHFRLRRPNYGSWIGPRSPAREIQNKLPHAVRTLLHQASGSWEIERSWISGYEYNDMDSVAAVLIFLLPELRTLDLEHYCSLPVVDTTLRYICRLQMRETGFSTDPLPMTEGAFQGIQSNGVYQSFAHLTDVFLHSALNELAAPSCVFTIPSVRRLFLYGGHVHDLKHLPAGSSNIEHLELHNSTLTNENEVDLLRVPKALRTFISKNSGGLRNIEPFSRASTWLSQNALKCSLEALRIDVPLYGGAGPRPSRQPSPSFHDFRSLKRLIIPGAHLFDGLRNDIDSIYELGCCQVQGCLASLLPSSIETVQISCEMTKHMRPLCVMMEHLLKHNPSLPHLKIITILPISNLGIVWESSNVLSFHYQIWDALGIQITLVTRNPRYNAGRSREERWGLDEEIDWATCTR